MDLQELLKRIRERKSRDGFGYGITTADRYIEQVVKSAGIERIAQYIGDADLATVLKEAQGRTVYANPDSGPDKIVTNSADFKAILPSGMEPPKNTLMVIKHTLTTPKEDRDRDVLETSGAEVDPKMPLLWQHMHTLPIGKRMATLMHNAKKLQLASVLLDINELTSDAAKLIEADVLRFSHGFRTLEWEDRYDKQGNWLGFRIMKFEIMEASLVSVPSNTDAVIEMYSRDKLCSELMKAVGKSLMDERSVQVPGGINAEESEETDDETDEAVEAIEADDDTEPDENIEPKSVGDAPILWQHDKDAIWKALDELHEQQADICEDWFVEKWSDVFGGETQRSIIEEVEEEFIGEGNKSSTVDGTKAGREISAKNLAVLQDCLSDLEAFVGSDAFEGLKRSEKVMLSGCYDRLKELVERLAGDGEESAHAETKTPDPPATIEDTAKAALELVDVVLCSGNERWKRRTLEVLKSRIAVEEQNAKGELFSAIRKAAT